MAWLLAQLIEKNALVVCGSGNDGTNIITGLPAVLAALNPPTQGALNYVPDLLVVGAVNSQGQLWASSNSYAAYGLPHVYAPGWDVSTANRAWIPQFGADGLWLRNGTSLGKHLLQFQHAYKFES